jgi:hypothetical protein
MSNGKVISLFLIDGKVDGVIACELSNWTGKGYRIPRNLLKTVAQRDDLRKTGVYFLVGYDPESDQPLVYVGETEEVYKRLTEHQEKDFWFEALTFISKDENLNKAHIKFLEYTLHKEVMSIGRCKLDNANIPNCPAISEAEKAVMLEFAENLQVMAGALGFKFFEALVSKNLTQFQDAYQIQAARGANARSSEGFVVLKGSKIADSVVQSSPPYVSRKRDDLMTDRSIIDLTLTKDVLFNSPSLAAAVVLGRSSNGLVEWKLKTGKTLKDNQAVQT